MDNKNWANSAVLMDIANKFKTPLYVYDENRIRKNYRSFYLAFKNRYPKTKVLYAYKANTNLTICSIIRREGAGADVVSGEELKTAFIIGVKPGDIMFTGNSKSQDELKTAVSKGVVINIDSLDELKMLEKILAESGKKARISFRINPAIDPKTHQKVSTGIRDSKFGIHIEKDLAFNAYKTAKEMKNVKIAGIHTHIGSQIMDVKVFAETAERIMEFVFRLKNELDIELEFVDFGGGLGISYRSENAPIPEDMAKAVIPVVQNWAKKINYEPQLWLEPGRYIVGDAGILLCKVQSVKKTPYRNFVNVDAGFSALLRPAMYDAYHGVSVVGKENIEATERYDIAGNLCESGDILARDRLLPEIKIGDVIAIHDVGAYGFCMSSNYNSKLRPAEILVREKSAEIIRHQRCRSYEFAKQIHIIRERETIDDLFARQRIPEDLI